MKNLFKVVIGLVFVALASACTPDTIKADIYTSDIIAAAGGELLQVPVTVTFSMLGSDEDGLTQKAIDISKPFMSENTTYTQAKGNYGQSLLIIQTELPMSTFDNLQSYLTTNTVIGTFVVNSSGGSVSFLKTNVLSALNAQLSNVSYMLSLTLPAKSLVLNVISDSPQNFKVNAAAVFVSNKAELSVSRDLKRRDSVALDFRGGSDSIYSQINPFFGYSTAETE